MNRNCIYGKVVGMLSWRRSESVPLALGRGRCRPARLLKGQKLSEAETSFAPEEDREKITVKNM